VWTMSDYWGVRGLSVYARSLFMFPAVHPICYSLDKGRLHARSMSGHGNAEGVYSREVVCYFGAHIF